MALRDSKRLLEFLTLVDSIDPESGDRMLRAFRGLHDNLVSKRLERRNRLRVIKQIAAYLSKKARESDPALRESRLSSLHDARNLLIHSPRATLARDFASLYPDLWEAILEVSKSLPAREVDNLLAYCLGTGGLDLKGSDAKSARVVSVYRRIFDTLSAHRKREAFKELLLRFFASKNAAEQLAGMDHT